MWWCYEGYGGISPGNSSDLALLMAPLKYHYQRQAANNPVTVRLVKPKKRLKERMSHV
jgi:hypothetical protein